MNQLEEEQARSAILRRRNDELEEDLAAAEALEQRLADATQALIELIGLRRWLEENAGRMPDERADAYRIATGSSHWGRAERIVATLDTEHSSEPICSCRGEREEAPVEPDPDCPIHGADALPPAPRTVRVLKAPNRRTLTCLVVDWPSTPPSRRGT